MENTKKKIMVVDDDKEFLEEFKEMLIAEGYEVVAISESAAVPKLADKLKPDLILLDLRMKSLSGFEVAGALKHSPETAHIPIIAISGYYTMKEHEFLVTICGIDKFLKKPVNLAEAVLEIENIFKNRESEFFGETR